MKYQKQYVQDPCGSKGSAPHQAGWKPGKNFLLKRTLIHRGPGDESSMDWGLIGHDKV